MLLQDRREGQQFFSGFLSIFLLVCIMRGPKMMHYKSTPVTPCQSSQGAQRLPPNHSIAEQEAREKFNETCRLLYVPHVDVMDSFVWPAKVACKICKTPVVAREITFNLIANYRYFIRVTQHYNSPKQALEMDKRTFEGAMRYRCQRQIFTSPSTLTIDPSPVHLTISNYLLPSLAAFCLVERID